MSDPFLGEIRLFAGTYAPLGWALCDGRLLPISQNDALFSLFGTLYGGDGINTFGLPDLRGRCAPHAGQGLLQGALGGSENVTLTTAQLPAHSHPLRCASVAQTLTPSGGYWASDGSGNVAPYSTTLGGSALAAGAVAPAGASQPHENMQPFLALNFIVALEGIYPSRS
ncbi:phage tail protein [Plasticicumulans acidivorans]|uniref:Microcystin-dependent protein n=1 Tax=Plasticicumulans acidivorans TaxID=886464 RepID=A0A317MRL7_9GAMM|nr:tail fiber protein [Plasticicumulans acidivorans]PWV59516.1 microcystin-dependent protein [Plasticicumulans acidivorans]